MRDEPAVDGGSAGGVAAAGGSGGGGVMSLGNSVISEE